MLVSAAPVRDPGGQVTAGVMIWYDITRAPADGNAVARRPRQRPSTGFERAPLNWPQTHPPRSMPRSPSGGLSTGRAASCSAGLVSGQEDEQRRISRELHDQFGQSLTGLKFILNALVRRGLDRPAGSIGRGAPIVDDLTNRVSELALDLRPAVLDDMGVVPALITLIGRFTTQTGITIDFQHSGMDERLDPEVETAIYRVVQEALTNVARHSGATQVRVQLLLTGTSSCG